MNIPDQYRVAESLEDHLGDPLDPGVQFSFRRVIELDEAEVFPRELIDILNEWGMSAYLVPVSCGGKLASMEQLMALVRCISRRDLTVAVGLGVSLLGAMPVWLAGSPGQRQRVAEILAGNQLYGFAMSEKDHGHDVLANELAAERTENGYLLTGKKWTFGNATRSAGFTLYARTDKAGGPRGFSLFLIDKQKLDRLAYAPTPRVKTLGLRGLDLSGAQFSGCFVPDAALIGAPGAALDLFSRGVQVTKSMCAGLAIGVADSGLRAVLDFADRRVLYGNTLLALPHARWVLVDAFLDLLICDCLAISTARAWHSVTAEMSVWSAIAKYAAPVTLEVMLQNISRILGARFFIREEHIHGLFQKLYRDLPVVGIVEGSSISQLHQLGVQLPQIMRRYRWSEPEESRVRQLFTLTEPLPDWLKPDEFQLHAHGQDTALQGLRLVPAQLAALAAEPGVNAAVIERLQDQTRELLKLALDLAHLVETVRFSSDRSAEALEMARRFSLLHTAAACLLLWTHNRRQLSPFFAGGEWLVLCLDKLLHDRTPARGFCSAALVETVAEGMLELYRQGRMFSIVPLQLARSVAWPAERAREEAVTDGCRCGERSPAAHGSGD